MKEKILPQANNLETVINIFKYVSYNSNISKNEISNIFDFDLRQADYYLSANIYLGLIDDGNNLTELGNKIINSNKIIENIFKLILQDEIISEIYLNYVLKINSNLKELSYNILKERFPEYSDAVIKRRASTIINWLKYIFNYINSKK